MAHQTAVEQLINYMKENFHLTDESLQKFDEAKEMEKEQIKNAWIVANDLCTGDDDAEYYYTQTYGNNTKID
jgi:hypothetical protein